MAASQRPLLGGSYPNDMSGMIHRHHLECRKPKILFIGKPFAVPHPQQHFEPEEKKTDLLFENKGIIDGPPAWDWLAVFGALPGKIKHQVERDPPHSPAAGPSIRPTNHGRTPGHEVTQTGATRPRPTTASRRSMPRRLEASKDDSEGAAPPCKHPPCPRASRPAWLGCLLRLDGVVSSSLPHSGGLSGLRVTLERPTPQPTTPGSVAGLDVLRTYQEGAPEAFPCATTSSLRITCARHTPHSLGANSNIPRPSRQPTHKAHHPRQTTYNRHKQRT